MNTAKKIFQKPLFHVFILAGFLTFVMASAKVAILDDTGYQEFAQTLVEKGKIDFSIPGFHGLSFFAAITYFFTRSEHAVAYTENIFSALAVFIIYFAVKEIFQDKLRGVFASYLYVLMPFINLLGFRGWSHPSMSFFIFLTLWTLWKKPKLSWIPWGISMIIKPFPAALFPFFLYKKRYKEMFFGLLVPAVYVFTEILQTGRVMIGVHRDLTPDSLFSLRRVPLNIAFAFQSFFSVHNFTPFNPTYVTDLIYFSPFVTFFALFAVIYWKKYFQDKKFFLALLSFSAVSFLIPASFYYFDRYYFITFGWSLILFFLAVIAHFKKFIPVIAAHFWFQFFYFYLSYQKHFWPSGSKIIFLIPLWAFFASVVYAVFTKKQDDVFSTSPKV